METKFLHLGDIHIRDESFEEIWNCMGEIVRVAEKEKPDFTIIAGDLWDSKIFIHRRCIDAVAMWLDNLSKHGPVYMIYGTPSHDIPGSLDIFGRVHSHNPIHVIKQTIILSIDNKALLGLYPHQNIPSQKSVEETVAFRRKTIQKEINTIYDTLNKEDPNHSVPHIFVGHLAIDGCVIPIGTDGFEASPDVLLKFDYAALGHVHPKDQKLPMNVQYSGALWHTDIADMQPKGFFVVTLNTHEPKLQKTFYNAGSHPVVRFDTRFGENGIPLPDPDAIKDARVRLTVYVPSSLRRIFDVDKISKEILDRGAFDVKIVPRVLSDSIEVVDFGYTRKTVAGDWMGKFKAYCDASEIEVTQGMIDKTEAVIKEVG